MLGEGLCTAKNYHSVSLLSVGSNILNLLTVVSDWIARAFNRSRATQAITLDIPKAFGRVWHAGLLHKIRYYRISGQIFGLILSFLSNRLLWMVLGWKFSQEYQLRKCNITYRIKCNMDNKTKFYLHLLIYLYRRAWWCK